MDILEDIKDEILKLQHDVRAEVIVAQLLSREGEDLPLIVHTDGFFYRKFSKDVIGAMIDDTADIKELLHIHLSRTGLYDLLPEGLFFKPQSAGRTPKNAMEMAEEYKANKNQENQIRKFFNPLENEFFRHRYKNFVAETSLMNGPGNMYLSRYFTRFWKLPDDINPGMALRMVLLFPYIHEFAGDTGLMAASLQTILNEEVTCVLGSETAQQTGLQFNMLGDFALGNELVCGNSYEEEIFCYVFTIQNLGNSSAQDYLAGGKLYSTLQTFYRFFVPAGATVRTEIRVLKTKESMYIGTGEEATLGIATVL